jgi:hypothetical protein
MRVDRVRQLRHDFALAISCGETTLDAAVTALRVRIGDSNFLEPFSIYSKGHLRRIDDRLRDISSARLKNDPLRVAMAVEAINDLLDRLATTVEQSAASDKWIEANRSSYPHTR